jgi:hypothetical protein
MIASAIGSRTERRSSASAVDAGSVGEAVTACGVSSVAADLGAEVGSPGKLDGWTMVGVVGAGVTDAGEAAGSAVGDSWEPSWPSAVAGKGKNGVAVVPSAAAVARG